MKRDFNLLKKRINTNPTTEKKKTKLRNCEKSISIFLRC